jgi:predicted kinase
MYIHINPDHYLQTETGRIFTTERNKIAWERAYADLASALSDAKESRHLYIVFGVQGAGKSSWIRENASAFPNAIFFDAALPAKTHRARALAIAKNFGTPVIAVWIKSSLESALLRNLSRPSDERVPEAAVRSVFAMLEPPSLEEGFVQIIEQNASGSTELLDRAQTGDANG